MGYLRTRARSPRARPAATASAKPRLLRDDPNAALVGEVGVRPLEQHAQPVAEADEIHDVKHEPEPPCEPPGEVKAPKIGDRLVSDRKSTRLNSSHLVYRMPSSA